MKSIIPYPELQEKTGYSDAQLRRIMSGEVKNPAGTVIFKIADHFNINPRFLFEHPDGISPEEVLQRRLYGKLEKEEVAV